MVHNYNYGPPQLLSRGNAVGFWLGLKAPSSVEDVKIHQERQLIKLSLAGN